MVDYQTRISAGNGCVVNVLWRSPVPEESLQRGQEDKVPTVSTLPIAPITVCESLSEVIALSRVYVRRGVERQCTVNKVDDQTSDG